MSKNGEHNSGFSLPFAVSIWTSQGYNEAN